MYHWQNLLSQTDVIPQHIKAILTLTHFSLTPLNPQSTLMPEHFEQYVRLPDHLELKIF